MIKDSGLHKLWNPAIRNGRTWNKFGEYGEHGEHGKMENIKPEDLKTHDSKRSIHDLKHSLR